MKASTLWYAIVLFLACGGKEKPSEQPRPDVVEEANAPKPIAPEEVQEPVEEPDLPPIAKEEVQAALDAWLAAQNDGDFEAYASSYAQRLTGIKRVGSRTKGYDRKSWLQDRGRMFRKKMRVKAEDVEIRSIPNSAVVRFTQTWASGSFKDVGPKQLIVIVENHKVVIAREEMLSSAVVRSGRRSSGGLDGFFFAGFGIDEFVLQDAEREWATGRSKLIKADESPYVSSRAAALKSLPEEWKSSVGTPVTVWGADGACTDEIASLQIVAGVTPHFMYFQDGEGEREVSDRRMARDFFKMAGTKLVASLTGKCKGPIMRIEGKGDKIQALAKVSDVEMLAKVQGAFDALPHQRRLQKRYLRETDKEKRNRNSSGKWHDTSYSSLFYDRQGNRHLAVMSAIGWFGCVSFQGSLTAIFQIGDDGSVQLLGTTEQGFEATGAYDLNGDGRVEFHGIVDESIDWRAGVIGITNGKYDLLHVSGWDYHDCPC